MTSILNKFKSIAVLVLVFSFFMGMTLSSCSGEKKSADTEKTEAASESAEHPEGGEHPAAAEEHPSDSTKTEHPAKEHPKKD